MNTDWRYRNHCSQQEIREFDAMIARIRREHEATKSRRVVTYLERSAGYDD